MGEERPCMKPVSDNIHLQVAKLLKQSQIGAYKDDDDEVCSATTEETTTL